MENMKRFTPLYAIAYAIMNGTENLRFDKEDYFHVLVFYTGYFIKEIENIFSRGKKCFPWSIQWSVETLGHEVCILVKYWADVFSTEQASAESRGPCRKTSLRYFASTDRTSEINK